jgi:hypothetical protein
MVHIGETVFKDKIGLKIALTIGWVFFSLVADELKHAKPMPREYDEFDEKR